MRRRSKIINVCLNVYIYLRLFFAHAFVPYQFASYVGATSIKDLALYTNHARDLATQIVVAQPQLLAEALLQRLFTQSFAASLAGLEVCAPLSILTRKFESSTILRRSDCRVKLIK